MSFTSNVYSQYFYNFISDDSYDVNSLNYRSIVEGINGNIYTSKLATDNTMVITAYSMSGEFINLYEELLLPIDLGEIARDMYFNYNTNKLLVIYADTADKPIVLEFSPDLSTHEKYVLDIENACPWRIDFLEDSIVMLCYTAPYKDTKIITLDYEYNELGSKLIEDFDPWDFSIFNDSVTYVVARLEPSSPDFYVKRIINNVIEDFIIPVPLTNFPQIEKLNDSTIVISSSQDIYIFNLLGELLNTYPINSGVSNWIKFASLNNKVHVSWAPPDDSLKLLIIYRADSLVTLNLLPLDDISILTHAIYSSGSSIYIYGSWCNNDSWDYSNPLIVKTDEEGKFDPILSVNHNINYESVDENTFKFYPNPTQGNLTIERLDNKSNYVYIYDESGRLVYETDISKDAITEINVSSLQNGVYFINTEHSSQIQKLIKL